MAAIKSPASVATDRILSLTNHLKDSLNPADVIQEAKMSAPYKFAGWMGLDKDSVQGKMVWQEFEPKTWTEDDVDIKVTHCGICGSDLHTLRSGCKLFHLFSDLVPELSTDSIAGGPTIYPCCVGHEVAGAAIRVGKNVKHVKVGDRVGVGAQSGSCLDCEECDAGLEHYCSKGNVGTYNGKYPDGSKSYGGYSE
jgi:alcohol dehydrogenase (NADP+)